MIVGNGQIANIFKTCELPENIVIFASGVSNSCCTDIQEFDREEEMLTHTLNNLNGNKVVYFSSCALSVKNYSNAAYYQHKTNMELLIKNHTHNYYIFRVPQLFGKIKQHPTLINYLYYAIKDQKKFNLHKGATRYVIELQDLKSIVLEFIKIKDPKTTIDIANTYRYSLLEIIKVFEDILKVKAVYDLENIDDSYTLDLASITSFVNSSKVNILFGQEYLSKKIKDNLPSTLSD